MGNSSSVPAPPQERWLPPPQEPSLSAPPMFVPDNAEPPKVVKQEFVNPGPHEQLHAQAREIFPQPFEGAKLTVNKPLSNYFQIGHNLALSNNPNASGYTFDAQYIHAKGNKPFLVLGGNMSPKGNFGGRIIGMFSENTQCRALFQEHDGQFMTQYAVEHSGKDYTASATFANVDPINQSGVGVFNYLQSWGKRLAVGAELVYQKQDNIPGKQQATFGLSGRYTGDDWTLAGTVNPIQLGLKLSGYSKISKEFEIAAEIEGSLAEQDGTASIGYKCSLPETDTVIKGSINTDLVVICTLEKVLHPLPYCTLALSGVADQKRNQYKWGMGITFG